MGRAKGDPGHCDHNPNEGPEHCGARCYPCSIDGRIEAAIVLPDVAGDSPRKIEVIAAVGVRDALGLRDGDLLTLELGSRG
jgi:CTP-dependent riboflavin kinase